MTQEEFNVVFELQMRKCADILAHKKKEYTGDNIDRLSAFKIAAALLLHENGSASLVAPRKGSVD